MLTLAFKAPALPRFRGTGAGLHVVTMLPDGAVPNRALHFHEVLWRGPRHREKVSAKGLARHVMLSRVS